MGRIFFVKQVDYLRRLHFVNNFRFLTSVILIIFFTLVNTPLILAASFNCKKASTAVEKAICSHAELSALDSKMARAYKQLLTALPKSEATILKEDQREWLFARDEAFHACDRDSPEDCLMYEYAVRITALGPLKRAGFDCKKASIPVEKKICSSQLLGHADGKIAEIYRPRREEFKESQRAWLQERNIQLADATCRLKCAWDFYEERIRFFVHQNF